MKRLLFFVLLMALFGLASCGSAPASTAVTCTTTTATSSTSSSTSTCTDPVTGISVTIFPATASVNVATSQVFQDFIQGGTNTQPIWQVNGMAGGSDAVGIIDSHGQYHAPTTIPSPNIVSVSVASSEDPKVFATSTVTITPAPVVTITSPSAPVTVPSGTANTVNFSATETGGTTNTILWYVGPVGGLGVSGGNATFGTISASGLYSAPLTPPIGQTVIVTAGAQDSPTSTATLAVTISGYSTSSLQGQFVFSLSGSDASGHFFRAGSFVADGVAVNGKGHLNSVLEDVNSASLTTTTPISTTGTYTVGVDGRGTLQFNDGLSPTNFDFVLVNGTQLQIIGFDASGTATGQANKQDPSTFQGAPLSALNGTYVFDFAGVHGSSALSQIGEFSADGAGNVTDGSVDINDGGTLTQFQIAGSKTPCIPAPSSLSTYSISSNGRGTLTLATVNAACAPGPSFTLNFYVATRGGAKFVGTDPVLQVAGFTSQQAPITAFDNTALNGNYAFILAGSGLGGTIGTAGSFSANGAGCLTANTGVLDENVGGSPNTDLSFSPLPSSDPVCPGDAGKYTVAPNGRGTMTFATASRAYTFVFYLGPVGPNTAAVLQETDSGIASDGSFVQQQALVSIAVTPGNPSVIAGKTQQFTATGTFSDSSTQDLTNSVVWASQTTTVATINSTGLASTLIVGSSTISATFGSVTGSTTLTVTTAAAAQAPVATTLANASVASGNAQQFAAFQQPTTAFSLASIQGNYALETSGVSGAALQVSTGQLAANGMGALTSGNLDINTGGTTLTTGQAVTGSYTAPAANGRATLSLNSSTPNYAVYVVSSTQVFVLGIQSGQLAVGALLRQF